MLTIKTLYTEVNAARIKLSQNFFIKRFFALNAWRCHRPTGMHDKMPVVPVIGTLFHASPTKGSTFIELSTLLLGRCGNHVVSTPWKYAFIAVPFLYKSGRRSSCFRRKCCKVYRSLYRWHYRPGIELFLFRDMSYMLPWYFPFVVLFECAMMHRASSAAALFAHSMPIRQCL